MIHSDYNEEFVANKGNGKCSHIIELFARYAWISTFLFFVCEFLTAWSWRGNYSRRNQFVSELGVRVCDSRAGVCSWYWLMNISFVTTALGISVGTLLWWKSRVVSPTEGSFLLVSASGLILIAVSSLDRGSILHGIGANMYFVLANTAVIMIATSSRTLRRPSPAKWVALAAGVLGLSAYFIHTVGGLGMLGQGTIQRFTVYPSLIGLIALATVLGTEPATRREQEPI